MTKRRWILSVLKATTEPRPALPWQRGTRRLAMIARRKETAKAKLAGT